MIDWFFQSKNFFFHSTAKTKKWPNFFFTLHTSTRRRRRRRNKIITSHWRNGNKNLFLFLCPNNNNEFEPISNIKILLYLSKLMPKQLHRHTHSSNFFFYHHHHRHYFIQEKREKKVIIWHLKKSWFSTLVTWDSLQTKSKRKKNLFSLPFIMI